MLVTFAAPRRRRGAVVRSLSCPMRYRDAVVLRATGQHDGTRLPRCADAMVTSTNTARQATAAALLMRAAVPYVGFLTPHVWGHVATARLVTELGCLAKYLRCDLRPTKCSGGMLCEPAVCSGAAQHISTITQGACCCGTSYMLLGGDS